MTSTLQPKLFGSPLRTRILMLIAALSESYPAELARQLRAPLFSVQRIVDDLEREGVVASRRVGNERRVTLNQGYLGAPALRALLTQRADASLEIQSILGSVRRRPRRRGKPIEPSKSSEAIRARRLAAKR